jgi:LacI family transcriptional regulator
LSFRSEWVVSGNFEEKKAEKAVRELINRHKEVTAIFCASDLMALGALKACKELGLHVPKEMSIVGYDNIVLASYSSPILTTVGQEVYQIGYEAADLLIEMLEGKETNMKRYLDTKLIIRESTDKNHN